MNLYVIERFEQSIAVLECGDGSFIRLPRSVLPKRAKPGDVLREYRKGRYRVDLEETGRRKAAADAWMERMFRG